MTYVKLCGMTRGEDVAAAVFLGVSALGFILVPGSPRALSLEEAEKLAEEVPPPVSRVAVVRDPSSEYAARVAECGAFDCIQFHGSEDPAMLSRCRIRTVKAFSVAGKEDLDLPLLYGDAGVFLFDGRKTPAGTGRAFDHSLLRGRIFSRPFFLAGGLGPENLAEALGNVRPFGVDLNSGVESAPGVKDLNRLESALQAVRKFDDFERRQRP